jgi:hypothetical protein
MFGWFKQKQHTGVSFEEILLDASNLPAFNQGRLEGKMELPIKSRSIYAVGAVFIIIAVLFMGKLFTFR